MNPVYLDKISHIVNEAVNRAVDAHDFHLILSIRMENPDFVMESRHRDILWSGKFSRQAFHLFKTEGCVSQEKLTELLAFLDRHPLR